MAQASVVQVECVCGNNSDGSFVAVSEGEGGGSMGSPAQGCKVSKLLLHFDLAGWLVGLENEI